MNLEQDHDEWHEKTTTLLREMAIVLASLRRELDSVQREVDSLKADRAKMPELEWDEGA